MTKKEKHLHWTISRKSTTYNPLLFTDTNWFNVYYNHELIKFHQQIFNGYGIHNTQRRKID